MYKKLLLFSLALFLFVGLAEAEVYIITNDGVSESKLTSDDVKEIFLGMKIKWSDDTKIVFVLSKDANLHDEFLKTYVNRSAKQYKNYWRQMLFTGKGKMPKTLENTEEIMEFVSKNKGAIAYIDKNTTVTNIKTIDVQ